MACIHQREKRLVQALVVLPLQAVHQVERDKYHQSEGEDQSDDDLGFRGRDEDLDFDGKDDAQTSLQRDESADQTGDSETMTRVCYMDGLQYSCET